MFQNIPLVGSINQKFQVTLTINNENMLFNITVIYNEIAGYWVLTIGNAATNTVLVDSVPLFANVYPAGDLLGQFGYLEIGKWYIVNISNIQSDIPTYENLGTDYILVVGDNT